MSYTDSSPTLKTQIEEISPRGLALVVLSRKKFMIGEELPFAGYIVSKNGVRPNQERVSASRQFPIPRDQTGIKYFLGLANQLIFFIPDFAHHTRYMRELLGTGRVFRWLPDHDQEFKTMKNVLSDRLLTGVLQSVRHRGSKNSDISRPQKFRHCFGLGS